MQDKPTAGELLEALAAFLKEEVAAKVEGGLKFKVIVAANVAGIVARELRLGAAHDRAQLDRLRELLDDQTPPPTSDDDIAARVRELSFDLCRRIDAGDADDGEWRARLLEHLRQSVHEKLQVDNPRRK